MNTHVAKTRPRPTTLSQCRCCNSPNLFLFLPMGNHPPANMYARSRTASAANTSFPLNTQACLDCGLIQVADQVPADFFEDYLYVPSGAATMHTHFQGLAEVLHGIAGDGLIVDIGCNDGLMLSHAAKMGARHLGIDPAANLAPHARARGVEVLTAFFNPETARQVRDQHGPAAVIATSNTFNHIDNLHGFMQAVDILLGDGGSFVIEVPWGKMIVENNQFDNVYHEHLSELSLLSIVRLGQLNGFDVVDVTKLPVHGGSMRVFLRRATQGHAAASIVAEMLAEEHAAGLTDRQTYVDFAARVEALGSQLRAMLAKLVSDGKSIAGYGAPAKGNTLLNYFKIGQETLDFVVDKNPLKQGLFTPGMQLEILPPEAVMERKPDVLLVLAWNFFDEIRAQMAPFEAAGGRFLVPLPMPHFVP